jgi:WD40 repeat protein
VNSQVLVGTGGNQLYQVDIGTGQMRLLLQGHAGELWGLASHPTNAVVATACDDCSVRLWDSAGHVQTKFRFVGEEGKGCAFSPDGRHLAVGCKSGKVLILDGLSLESVLQMNDRCDKVHALRYSPDGRYLACGSFDSFVDVYDATQNYKRCAVCKGHSSHVTHLDWSSDSKVLKTVCGAYELLYWEAQEGKQVPYASTMRDVDFQRESCILGWPVQGIWPADSDGTDVNAVAKSGSGTVLASADDFGNVKLFKYPVVRKHADCKKYRAHSSHVTNVAFSHNDQYVFSVGGADTAVMQWRHGDLKAP